MNPDPKANGRVVTQNQFNKSQALRAALQTLGNFMNFNEDLKNYLTASKKKVGGIDDLTGGLSNSLGLIIVGYPWSNADEAFQLGRQFYLKHEFERLDYLKTKYEFIQHTPNLGGSNKAVVDFTVAVTKARNALFDLEVAMGKDI